MGCLMLSGGREDPLYPRLSELYPRLTGPALREPELYELRSSPRPIASGLAGPDDARGDIGENFCQPPPLLLPFPRALGELPELPGRGAEPQFELPRVSWRDGELFRPVERDPAPLFKLLFNPPLPGRPFPNDRPFDPVAVLPRAEK